MENTKKKKQIDLLSAGRKERLERIYSENEMVSRRTFNLVMGGVVIYGLLVNVIMCMLFPHAMDNMNPIAFLIGYIVLCAAGVIITCKSNNPFISFLGYNMVVLPIGLVVSYLVKYYGGLDSKIVIQAFTYTLGITVIMTTAGVCFPDFFSKIGRVLLIALIGLIVCELIALLMGRSSVVFDVIGAGIFSLYIGYDFYRSQQFAPTIDNAVDCAMDIYLDIINLFLRILSILGKNKD